MEKVSTSDVRPQSCPVTRAVKAVGGKWKLIILWRLTHRTYRFRELGKSIPGITEKMLSQQLREMEHDGLVRRTVFPQVPPKVEYSLTPLGVSLRSILDDLNDWGQRHDIR